MGGDLPAYVMIEWIDTRYKIQTELGKKKRWNNTNTYTKVPRVEIWMSFLYLKNDGTLWENLASASSSRKNFNYA